MHISHRPSRGALRAPILLVALLIPWSATACSTVKGSNGHASVNGTLEALPDAPTMSYDRAPEIVWTHVKETLVHLSAREPRFENDIRKAHATLENGSVQVQVTDVGDGMTEVRVKARRYGVKSAELGASVLATIDEQIER